MKSQQTPGTPGLDVKNLCSRKLWELAASRSVDETELLAIADELQLRKHYLIELEQVLPSHRPQHH